MLCHYDESQSVTVLSCSRAMEVTPWLSGYARPWCGLSTRVWHSTRLGLLPAGLHTHQEVGQTFLHDLSNCFFLFFCELHQEFGQIFFAHFVRLLFCAFEAWCIA